MSAKFKASYSRQEINASYQFLDNPISVRDFINNRKVEIISIVRDNQYSSSYVVFYRPIHPTPTIPDNDPCKEMAIEILEWLADVNLNGVGGLGEHKIVLNDGEYYWESGTKDGDQPIPEQKLYDLFTNKSQK